MTTATGTTPGATVTVDRHEHRGGRGLHGPGVLDGGSYRQAHVATTEAGMSKEENLCFVVVLICCVLAFAAFLDNGRS